MKDKSRFKKVTRRCCELVSSGITSLKNKGVASTAVKTLKFLMGPHRISFSEWMATPLYTDEQLQVQRTHVFDRNVRFSIITPLYNTPERYLREMIESVIAQTYSDWELCMADGSDSEHDHIQRICLEYAGKDSRIIYKKLETNLGIAGNSNACIEMAKGDYISLLDHDDILHPAALHDTAEAVCDRGADLVYTDEAIFRSPDLDDISVIHFKPDFAPDNLLANNYICHFTSFSRRLLESCGAFREGFDGAQDHDLMLRLTAVAENIVHIPKVLYYWRAYPQSTAEAEDNKPYASEAGKKAVREYLKAAGIDAAVENARGIPTIYRVSYSLPSSEPKVSIIIPNCDHADDLKGCIDSIREKTTYSNYEIIIIENNSSDPDTFRYYDSLRAAADDVKIITWPGAGFNWAALNNHAVREAASGDYLLLLNNDTEIISPEWIEEMLMHAQRPDVGAVGAMLYYPDDTVQHAGVIMGIGSVGVHAFSRMKRGSRGYMGRMCYAQDLTAVTGACIMMRRSVWDEIGYIDEAFAVNYNDIDLCMRIRKAGYLIVWTPYAELYHWESKSRGAVDDPVKRAGLEHEKNLFRAKWPEIFETGDPYYNPNFSHRNARFELKDRKQEK